MESLGPALAALVALWAAWAPALGRAATTTATVVGALSLGSLLLPWAWSFTRGAQDLRKRYGASWALVTGGSSGIGLALAHQLAAQGLNVVIVAVPDATLAAAARDLAAAHPRVQVRSVGADLSRDGFMPAVCAATDDIPVQLVFNNAGYIVTGFFADTALERWLGNLHCNATAALVLTHRFVGRMRAERLRGAVAFTSSPANIIPSPFSSMYGASKALLTHFATSLACELRPDGIDVTVLHPSPVATSFYTGTHALPTLNFFKSTATGPARVAAALLAGVGRAVIVDQGFYPYVLRLVLRVFEITTLCELLPVVASGQTDFKYLKAATAQAQARAQAPTPAPTPGATTAAVHAPRPKRAGSPAPTAGGRRRRA